MQYVKLLTDVANTGYPLSDAVAAAKTLGMSPNDKRYPVLREKSAFGRVYTFTEDAVVPMSDESAQKYVDRGVGEIVAAPVDDAAQGGAE